MTDAGPDHDPYTIPPAGSGPVAPPRDHPRTTRPSDTAPDDTGKQRVDDRRGSADRRSGGEPPRIGADTLRRVRRLILGSALASITAVFLPPVGLVLGIVTAVFVWRWWSDLVTPGLTRATMAVVVFGSAFAVVVGGIGTVVAVIFAPELADYATCQTGANTHVAQDKCWAQLTEAIEERLTGG